MTLMDEALNYAEHGIYVFPCRSKYEGKRLNNKTGKWDDLNAKLPVGELVNHGVKDATLDLDLIRIWWKRRPESAIGADLGRSGLFVVDLDSHKKGINGIEHWHRLGISDEGCGKVLTPNGGGLHIYFRDPNRLGVTRSNEEKGIDFRGGVDKNGKGLGYSILPNSVIEADDGVKRKYTMLESIFDIKKELTLDIAEKLGIIRKERPKRQPYKNLSENDEFKEAEKILFSLPFEVIDNYSDWLKCSLYLRKFGDAGKDLFIRWTEQKYLSVKPNSKRGNLDSKWETFLEEKEVITIGTLKYYLNRGNRETLNF